MESPSPVDNVLDLYEERGITVVYINRPDRRNALTREARRALTLLLRSLGDSTQSRAMIIASRANAFSAGQDLEEAKDFSAEDISTWIDEHMELYRALLSFPHPLVAAIDGCCVGAGFQMALLCDLRIGTERSFFAMPELEDAIPCILGVWTLWDIVGRSRTTELVLTNRRVQASEAQSWGILNQIVPSSEEVLSAALDLADQMAKKPALAFRLTKERLRLLALQDDSALAIHATYAHATAFGTGQPRDAMQAFLEKRPTEARSASSVK